MSALSPQWREATLLLLFGLALNGCAARSHEEVDVLRRQNEQLRQSIEAYRMGLGDGDADALRRENDQLKQWLDRYVETYGSIDSGPVRGSVSAARGERIGVTMGSRDDVHVGDVLAVYRRNHIVGEVRVVTVTENCCVAEVVNIAPRAEPAIGDVVIQRPE
jgi:hypothetical protein